MLSGVKQTLLITLYAKARESEFPDSLLKDRLAAAAVRQLDFDFRRLHVTPDMMVALATRSASFDEQVGEFMARCPTATVLHLGCGLDTRSFRVPSPVTIRWIEVDYPEVIALRRRLYPAQPHVTMIGTSVTDVGWLAEIPTDRPVLVVSEGMLVYLERTQVISLLQRMVSHFRCGELLFDGYSRWGTWFINRQTSVRVTGARLKWSLDDPRDLEHFVSGFQLVEIDDWLQSLATSRLPWLKGWLFQSARRIPAVQRMGRLYRYTFQDDRPTSLDCKIG